MHIPSCQHIKTDGVRCGSPALRGQHFCYFHNEWRTRAPRNPQPRPRHPQLNVCNRRDIQRALNHVLRGLLAGSMGPQRTSLALTALQLASTNLARAEFIAGAPVPAPRVRV